MKHLKPIITKFWVACCSACFLAAPFGGSLSFGDTLTHAFTISKSKSANLVVYDVSLKDDCSFAGRDPLQVHWMIPERGRNGLARRFDLSATESAYYGLRMSSYSPNQIEGEIAALRNQKKDIKLILRTKKRGSHCLVAVSSSSKEADRASADFSNLSLDFNENFQGSFMREMQAQEPKADSNAATRYFISLQ